MTIYTKTGDKGKTALFGGKRVSKYDLQVEAYGITDEATCQIGLALESISDKEVREFLSDIQLDLYTIMAYLSGASLQRNKLSHHIKKMEQLIDAIDSQLPKLTRFVLPQGADSAVKLHMARAKVRTAERRIVEFVEGKNNSTEEDFLIIQYINRLSDCLFMLARKYSATEIVT